MRFVDLRFENRFVASLPGDPSLDPQRRQVLAACYSRVMPTAVAAPSLATVVPEVATWLGFDPTSDPKALAEILGGNRVLPAMQPYAACYGGHQFGSWAGQLGDGRAITLSEIINPQGERLELQLKGAGPTPYSRSGDGRAVLRSSLRELVASEAMFHLGVPTTRALALTLTGDSVVRDMFYDGHPEHEPGAICTRVAPSFLRFGSYEIHASSGDLETLRRLVSFTIETYFPNVEGTGAAAITWWFAEVCRRTARLVVDWMRVGFVHGVLNTDNMSILGLTIDYGPFGWMDSFDPDFTPNTTDAQGRRYRYAHQPRVVAWNLLRLASALVPLVGGAQPLQDALDAFEDLLEREQRRMMLEKLGLSDRGGSGDDGLIQGLQDVLAVRETDFALFFRVLADLNLDDLPPGTIPPQMFSAFYQPDAPTEKARTVYAQWLDRYRTRVLADELDPQTRTQRMNDVNPLYLPRNYLLAEVIDAATAGDMRPMEQLLGVLRRPYSQQSGREGFAARRPEWARHKPGCSMLSCSS